MVANSRTIDPQQLRVFIEVARRGGVTAGADALDIAKSAASRQLASLEATLGMRLFERTARKVSLTYEGRNLLPRAESVLADLDRLITDAEEESEQVRGRVRIAASPEFGQLLAERFIPLLLSRHPEINALLSLDYQFGDLHDPGTDLAFRLGHVGDDRLIARKLGEFSRILVCSPGYSKGRSVAAPEDLRAVNALLFSDRDHVDRWVLQHVEDPTRRCEVAVAGNLGIRGFGALAAAAEAGLGVASLPSFLAKARLASGALVRVLGDWTSPQLSAYVTFRPSVARIRRVRAVVDLAAEALAAHLNP